MSRNTTIFIFSAIAGAAVGAFLTYRETKAAMEELTDRAADIFDRLDRAIMHAEDEKIAQLKQDVASDEEFTAEYWTEYTEDTEDRNKPEPEPPYNRAEVSDDPYIANVIERITEEEMLNNPMYERVSLIYYPRNGGVYECVGNYRLEDPYSALGDNFADIFRDEEDTDVLFIRNHDQGVDYEVGLDYREPPEEE